MIQNKNTQTKKEERIRNSISEGIKTYGRFFMDSEKVDANIGIEFPDGLVDQARQVLSNETEIHAQKTFIFNLKSKMSGLDNFIRIESGRTTSMGDVLDRIADSGPKTNQKKRRKIAEKVKMIQSQRKKNAQKILLMLATGVLSDGQIVASIIEQNKEVLASVKAAFGLHGTVVPRREQLLLQIQALRNQLQMKSLMAK